MHTSLNIWLISLLSVCLSALAEAQTTKPLTTPPAAAPAAAAVSPAPNNTVEFHDLKRSESAPQPPPALRQVAAELSATLLGQSPNLSIEFILSLQNNWSQELKICDPLDVLSLQFSTIGKKPIPVPEGVPKFLIETLEDKKNMPFPAPIVFRRIVRGDVASQQKEEVLAILPGAKVQLVFESKPVVMERVMEALESETGESARSFKAKAFVSLINAPPQTGGRSLHSDPILLTLP